jgi:hypothetical protein
VIDTPEPDEEEPPSLLLLPQAVSENAISAAIVAATILFFIIFPPQNTLKWTLRLKYSTRLLLCQSFVIHFLVFLMNFYFSPNIL